MHNQKMKQAVLNRITEKKGHKIWDQPVYWLKKKSSRVSYRMRSYSVTYLMLKMAENEGTITEELGTQHDNNVFYPTCGEPRCVEPTHCKWYSFPEFCKLTALKGEQSRNTKLTDSMKEELLVMLNLPPNQQPTRRATALQYEVSVDTILKWIRIWRKEGKIA